MIDEFNLLAKYRLFYRENRMTSQPQCNFAVPQTIPPHDSFFQDEAISIIVHSIIVRLIQNYSTQNKYAIFLDYLPSGVLTGVLDVGTSIARTDRPSILTISTRQARDGLVRFAMRAETRYVSVFSPEWRGLEPVMRPPSSTPTKKPSRLHSGSVGEAYGRLHKRQI